VQEENDAAHLPPNINGSACRLPRVEDMRRLPLTAMLAATIALACAGHVAPGAASEAYLRVDNQTLTDYTMYIVTESGVRTRIGDALSLHRDIIPISNTWFGGSGSVSFVGVPKAGGSRTTRSERMHLAAGDTLSITIVQ
jgi:hypothetical protein